MIYRQTLSLSVLTLVLLLAACGGGGSSDEKIAEVLTGVFLDAPVAGISYTTATQSGITDDRGEFRYLAGETITFTIGGILLGSTQAQAVITPLLLAEDEQSAVNIVRLLLALDTDDVPDNGIQITDTTRDRLVNQGLDFSSASFEQAANGLLVQIGIETALPDSNQAQTHLNTTLATHWGSMTWGDDCWGSICDQSNTNN